jgi:hypothetical protein
MNQYDYSIRSAWPGRVQTPEAIGDQFLATLDRLQRIGSAFSGWGLGKRDQKELIPVQSGRSEISSLVRHNVRRDDYDEPDFDAGYSMFAANHSTAGYRTTPKTISCSVNAGSKWNWANEAFINTGGYEIPPDLSIITYPIFKAALLTMIATWPCTWANAGAFKSDYWEHSDAPGEAPMPSSIYHLSWMAYLSAERSAKLTPPAGVTWERTPDGGLLLIAAEERLDPTNPLHIQRSRAIVNFMLAQLGDPPEL